MRELSDLTNLFEKLWPLALAEEWDQLGLTVGRSSDGISKVLLSIDVTSEVIDEAIELGAGLILSHHPLLLRGVHSVAEETLKGHLVVKAIRAGVALYSAHTNADVVSDGVSDVLAKALGILNPQPLVPTDSRIGHGRVGEISSAKTLREFATDVAKAIPATSAPIRVAGDLDRLIGRVAVVGGAGDSFIQNALDSKVDCFVTSDLRHHVVLDAISHQVGTPLSLIDISHFAAESLWLGVAARTLGEQVPDVEFVVSGLITDPWSLTIGPNLAG